MVDRADETAPVAALAPALAAMTMLQAVVAAALFAPGLVASVAGFGAERLALWSSVVFAVGTATALMGGAFVRRRGPVPTAIFCAFAVVVGCCLLAASTGTVVFVVAAVAVGFAFGPETPASTALLGALTPPARRPLVMSVRQTGNQIGAASASLVLPMVAASLGVGWAFGLVAAGASVLVIVLLVLSRGWRTEVVVGAALSPRAVVRLLWERPDLAGLAFASIPWGALQLLVNGWTVLLAVETWGLEPVAAGCLLATAQIGGLVGRLGWGAVAMRVGTRPLLVALGLAMGATAALLALAGASLPAPLLWAGAAVLGLTASGWNGLFVAEVARLAPAGRMAETTGAVLTVSYFGLMLGPIVIAFVSALAGLPVAFAMIGLTAALAAVGLSRGRS